MRFLGRIFAEAAARRGIIQNEDSCDHDENDENGKRSCKMMSEGIIFTDVCGITEGKLHDAHFRGDDKCMVKYNCAEQTQSVISKGVKAVIDASEPRKKKIYHTMSSKLCFF
jgi:hypothetical protein